jgi:hypothetical protein
MQIPPGFQPIFDGKDLTGWHISQVNHHGNTKNWEVENGVLLGAQLPPGNGGILLTDKRYRDFEISLEVNPDWGCDGGLFLRSNEKGEAYQVMIDYLPGGVVGGVYGEGLDGVGAGAKGDPSGKDWTKYWKQGQWNTIRARVQGEVPHIEVWINGNQLVDWTDSANHLRDGATDGMIALQVHGGGRWVPQGYHRFRNVAIKEMK